MLHLQRTKKPFDPRALPEWEYLTRYVAAVRRVFDAAHNAAYSGELDQGDYRIDAELARELRAAIE